MKHLLLLFLIFSVVACPAQAQRHSSGRKDVHVSGYYRKNGTYVHSHDRTAPGMGSHSSSSRSHRSYSHSYSHSRGYSRSTSSLSSASSTRDRHGRIKRNEAARSSFQRQQPCPSTGRRSGDCPGYVVDHVRPLACGGADSPSNMQWQTVAEAKAKDKTERSGCR